MIKWSLFSPLAFFVIFFTVSCSPQDSTRDLKLTLDSIGELHVGSQACNKQELHRLLFGERRSYGDALHVEIRASNETPFNSFLETINIVAEAGVTQYSFGLTKEIDQRYNAYTPPPSFDDQVIYVFSDGVYGYSGRKGQFGKDSLLSIIKNMPPDTVAGVNILLSPSCTFGDLIRVASICQEFGLDMMVGIHPQ